MEYKFHSQIGPFRDEDVQLIDHDPNSMEFNFILPLSDVKIITKLSHFKNIYLKTYINELPYAELSCQLTGIQR